MFRMKRFLEVNKDLNIYINRTEQNWQLILPTVYHGNSWYIDKVIYHYYVRQGSHLRQRDSFFCIEMDAKPQKILKSIIKKIVIDKEKKEIFNYY